MRPANYILLGVVLLLAVGASVRADEAQSSRADIDTVEDVSLFMVDENGQLSTSYGIPTEVDVPRDVIFKYTVGGAYQQYDSWILEISDPVRDISFRQSQQGKLPPVLHWDGSFKKGKTIQPNQKYLMRLILVSEEKMVASPLAFFATQSKSIYEAPRVSGNFLKLFVLPTGAAYATIIQTKSYRSVSFPSLYGDIRLIVRDIHTIGIRFEATSDILFNYAATSSAFQYSDFSLYYRYRLLGAPLRPPVMAASPPYEKFRFRAPPVRNDLYGKVTNAEAGIRYFQTVLRGAGNMPIDEELARGMRGFALTLNGDHSLGAVRLHGALEGGYSFFEGKMLRASAEGTITLDRFPTVCPGLQVRYTFFHGTPASDPFDGVPSSGRLGGNVVTNHLFLAGLIMYFRL